MKLSNLLREITPVSFKGIRLERKGQRADRKRKKMTPSKMSAYSFSPNPEITSVHYRSQDVKPGGLFVAIEGLAAAALRKAMLEGEFDLIVTVTILSMRRCNGGRKLL